MALGEFVVATCVVDIVDTYEVLLIVFEVLLCALETVVEVMAEEDD